MSTVTGASLSIPSPPHAVSTRTVALAPGRVAIQPGLRISSPSLPCSTLTKCHPPGSLAASPAPSPPAPLLRVPFNSPSPSSAAAAASAAASSGEITGTSGIKKSL